MTHMSRCLGFFLAILTGSVAAAGENPNSVAYRTQGTGAYSPWTGDYGGVGAGTHLGRHTFSGKVAISPTANPLVFDFSIFPAAPQETIAANGDTLLFSSTGQVELIPLDETFTTFSAVWSGDFVVVGGTGRFANAQPADKPLHVVAINDPFTFLDAEWTFSWELMGRIVLP
jgi:hypothetical protein